jgi:glyoxylase-like metal-dependent hydrolase (beta-lactamase superfamily II)
MATTHQTASERMDKESSDPARTANAIATEIQGLYASTPEALPFAPSLDIRAFLLRRDHGNLLLYSTTTVRANAPAIEELGGISRHYLNHGHEALFPSEGIDAPLFVHASERESVSERYDIRGTFSKRHALDEDLEVIPTPGHTPGATAYLWDSGEQRLLFTGDTIYLKEGEWVAAVLASSDRRRYIESLELIADLDFDVLVPWAATRGQPYYALTERADAKRRIAAILERLRRGEDH